MTAIKTVFAHKNRAAYQGKPPGSKRMLNSFTFVALASASFAVQRGFVREIRSRIKVRPV
ncbi:MAG: hypothetical protein VB102_14115 [Paludibacter sp.]|nr:hypothetical protein [Paludibacter sp.]